MTNSHQKPDHETQVRPLIGLTTDQAQAAWNRTVEKAGNAKITQRVVKAAVVELGFKVPPANASAKLARTQRRKMVTDSITELLALIQKKELHQALCDKGQISSFFDCGRPTSPPVNCRRKRCDTKSAVYSL